MWFIYSSSEKKCRTEGLAEKRLGQRTLYYSNQLSCMENIRELNFAEYQQAIEIDHTSQQIHFGRDYLGHFPLFYAYTKQSLFVSDDVRQIREWLSAQQIPITLSPFSIALYLSMGYIPQGYTAFNEVHSCRNTTIYSWQNGHISINNLFTPVEVNPTYVLANIDEVLRAEIGKIFDQHLEVDVWCSGGLDSSIIALLCNRSGHTADLLTLQHAADFKGQFGSGELPFVMELQKYLNANLRTVDFSLSEFQNAYLDFLDMHPGPVIDPVVTPKYMLASKTRSLAVTGEGGDPIFAGVKNNAVNFMHNKHPDIPFGTIYALAHLRLFDQIDEILLNGQEYKKAVSLYLQQLWDDYPGSNTRKLFYMNTLEKQGGMIFPKNYFAGKYGKVQVRHPMTSLSVYQTAFALDDDLKYQYPGGKLALTRLYEGHLPVSIIKRKKSGTLVPLTDFVNGIHKSSLNFNALIETGLFNEEFLISLAKSDVTQLDNSGVFKFYAMLTLNHWLEIRTPLKIA